MNDVVYQYTRRQAIADGVLVDVSELARECRITYPVALTRSVWCRYVDVPEELQGLQDEQGRLWDILTMFRLAARRKGDGHWLRFELHVKNDVTLPPQPVTLNAHVGPGDDMQPVITIMLPGED